MCAAFGFDCLAPHKTGHHYVSWDSRLLDVEAEESEIQGQPWPVVSSRPCWFTRDLSQRKKRKEKEKMRGWNNDSEIKTSYCSWRGPGFGS